MLVVVRAGQLGGFEPPTRDRLTAGLAQFATVTKRIETAQLAGGGWAEYGLQFARPSRARTSSQENAAWTEPAQDRRVVAYMAAQCLGAICGVGLVKAFMKSDFNSLPHWVVGLTVTSSSPNKSLLNTFDVI